MMLLRLSGIGHFRNKMRAMPARQFMQRQKLRSSFWLLTHRDIFSRTTQSFDFIVLRSHFTIIKNISSLCPGPPSVPLRLPLSSPSRPPSYFSTQPTMHNAHWTIFQRNAQCTMHKRHDSTNAIISLYKNYVGFLSIFHWSFSSY